MTGNAYFTAPSLGLAAILTAIIAVENAELDVLNHVRGALQVRNSKQKALKTLLEKESQYVEDTANATPELAEAICLQRRDGSEAAWRKKSTGIQCNQFHPARDYPKGLSPQINRKTN